MKITELLDNATEPQFSYEIIPPKRGGSINQLIDVVDGLVDFEPPYIDVTSHSAQVSYEEQVDGSWKRHVKRKRPGTLGMCAAIRGRFGIETVPHLLCYGFSREESEDALIELNYLGIQNVMALRGDDNGYRKPLVNDRSRNEYAGHLVKQISDMNAGRYLEDLMDSSPTDFCVGVAGYPERHFEAPNLTRDILNLKRKVDAGAAYITTQMCFDSQQIIEFEKKCREVGITVPIVPGLKIMTSKAQLKSLPRNFFIEIPELLAAEVEAAKDEHVAEIGIAWAKKQSEDLINAGFPNIHFYLLMTSKYVRDVVGPLRKMA
jgi:methylenetetrahydrofolate reductase (NADPH)